MLQLFINFFGSILLVSVCMTLCVNNAIYAVLFLVLSFFSAMCLLFIIQIDYLSILFILIYVGAIVILFLFVIMMLKITEINDSKKHSYFSLFINIIICCIILYNFIFSNTNFVTVNLTTSTTLVYTNWFSKLYNIDNIKMLGQVLFNNFYFYFILVCFILLIGILGSVLLSKDSEYIVRRHQLISQQLSRTANYCAFLVY